MSRRNAGFDRLAYWYRWVEYLAFGRDLERARFAFLSRLSKCSDILLLGEGDGRYAARLAEAASTARILCVDSSPAMLKRAARRIAGTSGEGRATFTRADLLTFVPEAGRHDAVVACFVLDCFNSEQVQSIVTRMSQGLRPGATWCFADFVLPERGAARLRARAWLWFLYAFFRWETGIRVSSLPPSEEILIGSGWRRVAFQDLQHGLLRSAVFARD